jgi:hypothetical protein
VCRTGASRICDPQPINRHQRLVLPVSGHGFTEIASF